MHMSPTKCDSQTGAVQMAQVVVVRFPHLLMSGRIAHFLEPPPNKKARESSISFMKSTNRTVLIRPANWAADCVTKRVQCLNTSTSVMERFTTPSTISFS